MVGYSSWGRRRVKHDLVTKTKQIYEASWVMLVVKNPPANAGDVRDICLPPGEGHSNPLQYSCLENPMDRGVWWAMVYRVAKSRTQLKWLSIQFSHSVVSNSLCPHGLQHARLKLNLCPSSWWCIQPSHSLSSPSPPAFNLSQHQGLFKWVSSSHQVVKVLEFQLQPQSLKWTPRTDLL